MKFIKWEQYKKSISCFSEISAKISRWFIWLLLSVSTFNFLIETGDHRIVFQVCLSLVPRATTQSNQHNHRPDEPPPHGSETTCYFFVPCFTFPTEPVCALPKNLCGGAYTFANSCYLSFYNCEHPSNGIIVFDCWFIGRPMTKLNVDFFTEYYQYRTGECYPKYIIDPPPIYQKIWSF